MKETDLQSKCVMAIREMGGFSQKTSNRFLIGVPDVLCQLPGYKTSFWEVKYGPSTFHNPNPTPKQKMWMRDFTHAGGLCGVIYFLKDLNDVLVGIKPADHFDLNNLNNKWRIPTEEYVRVPRGSKMVPFMGELERVHATRK